MENKAAELAQEYARKLQEVRKEKENWDSRYGYFKKSTRKLGGKRIPHAAL